MQTFLPYPEYVKSGEVLHPQHLGNQFYHEGLTLLRGGWQHHPASKMWRGYEWALAEYLLALHEVLNDRNLEYWHIYDEVRYLQSRFHGPCVPHWLGNEDFHASHRSNLLRKDKEKGWNWYIKYNWTEPDNLPYVWPSGKE